jgi:hypothetical protein
MDIIILKTYPNGLPVPSHNVFTPSGLSVLELFLEYENTMQPFADEKILIDYALYYINAPCFRESLRIIDYLRWKTKTARDMNFAQLLLVLMEMGYQIFV